MEQGMVSFQAGWYHGLHLSCPPRTMIRGGLFVCPWYSVKRCEGPIMAPRGDERDSHFIRKRSETMQISQMQSISSTTIVERYLAFFARSEEHTSELQS